MTSDQVENPGMTGRVAQMLGRLEALEVDMASVNRALERLDDKWQKSVDDIKATIKSEIGELKGEQIADLKTRVNDGYRMLNEYNDRLRDYEKKVDAWDTGRSVVNYLIKAAIALISLFAGAFGWEHLRH